MKEIPPFVFRRARGIVWVCDIEKSSSYLNDNILVDDIEQFIPRLFYTSKTIVESYGGAFMKWTGDGFLAWFEIELDRHKADRSAEVIEAAMHLSMISNVTQLGLNTKNKIKLRHAVTYEKDALLMTLKEEKNYSYDIIGRSVVLAFRLSSIVCDFPNIVTVKEFSSAHTVGFGFKKWNPDKDEVLKYFKGEPLGTDEVFISTRHKDEHLGLHNVIEQAKLSINKAEGKLNESSNQGVFNFVNRMTNSSKWANQIIKQYADFIQTQMVDSLKELIVMMSKVLERSVDKLGEHLLISGKEFTKWPWHLNYWGSYNQVKTNRVENDKMIFEARPEDLLDPRKQYGAFLDLCNDIKRGSIYEIKCYVRSLPNTTMTFQLWLHDREGNESVLYPSSPIVPKEDGEEIIGTFKATKSGCIRIHLHNSGGNGSIIVEKVSVKSVQSA